MNRKNSDFRDLFKTPQQKSYTIIGLTFITLAFFVFFAIRPTIGKIASIQNEIKKLESVEKQIDTKTAKLSELIELRDSNKEKIEIFEKYFPNEKDTSLLVANFEKIAEEYDLLLTRVSFEDVEEEQATRNYSSVPGTFSVISTNITVEGELENIQKYIKHLEDYPRLINVIGVNFTDVPKAIDDNSDRVGYSANLITDIFHYRVVDSNLTEEGNE